MRRKLLILLLCMPLCLLLIPNNAPVALSVPGVPQFIDDGKKLAAEDDIDALAQKDPVAFLEMILRRQVREVKGYSGLMKKQERIGGKEYPPEVIDFWFREQPYSVLMKWRDGARDGKASLYVEGQNKNQVAVQVNRRISFTWDVDPEGARAKAGARYSVREFSLRQGTERTLRAWKAAQEKGILKVEYLGKKKVAELGDRECFVLKRTCNPPEEEGVVTVEIAVDTENWLQIGSTLIDGENKLIGRYHFPQLTVNPEFAADQFERSQVKK